MLPDLDRYYDRDTNYRHACINRRYWPIDEPDTGYAMRGAPSVLPGDIVTWDRHPDDTQGDRIYYSPFYVNKTVGLVLLTRWTLMDWADYEEREKLYPEALILWEDGDTTNTSHACLKRL